MDLEQEIYDLSAQCSDMMDMIASLQTNNIILSNFIMSTYDISGIDASFIASVNIRTFDICGNLIGCVTTDQSGNFVPCSDENEFIPCVLPPDLSNNMHVYIKGGQGKRGLPKPKPPPVKKTRGLFDYYNPYCPPYYNPYYNPYFPDYYGPYNALYDDYDRSVQFHAATKPRPPTPHPSVSRSLSRRDDHDYNRWHNWDRYDQHRWNGRHGPNWPNKEHGPYGPHWPNRPYRTYNDMSCN
jgi:hypothetical protein